MQFDLFLSPPRPRFDGKTIEPQDVPRLSKQLGRVSLLMADGEWRTLRTIADDCGCSEASASARLRDLRKPKFGAHEVERRRDDLKAGLWWYRVKVSK